jgi:SAM-dependent methyltransferase
VPEVPAPSDYPKWDYQEYPKTLPRDDFWGQVRRTILGERISEEDVASIVDHLRGELELRPSDILIDVGCGNGALAARFFDDCAGYAGADLSPYLIEVAREYFERPPDYLFFNEDAAAFAAGIERPERFTRGLCYAALQYFPCEVAESVLEVFWSRFPNLERLVLGNLPDREAAGLFFQDGYDDAMLDEHLSQIGRWWSREQMGTLAGRIGWSVGFGQMSSTVFNAKYRFDAVLVRE